MSDTPNNDEVICPNCVHQFRAIPVNVQDDLAAANAKLAALERENSKLRSALEIVHFKQEPWQ